MSNVLRREAMVANGTDRTAARPARISWGLLAALLIAVLWTFWSTIEGLRKDWLIDDNYSVGQIVPFAALYLLWTERQSLGRLRVRTCYWGVGVILAAQAARFFGLIAMFESAERYALVLTIAGIVLLVAGRRVFWEVKWILLFLFLMIPLPGRVHNLISGPLQTQATNGAVFALELLGTTISQDGNVIVLNDNTPIAVAEACSGLRMLTAFVVVSATLAYVVRRPPWQKVVLVLSSVPIAIFCNLIRLVTTAMLFLVASGELAVRFFHDFAGFFMMPMAVMVLVGEMWVMSQLVVEDGPDQGES